MKNKLALTLLGLLAVLSCNQEKSGLDYVDPEIGGVSMMLMPTYPTVQQPNQMIRWNPARFDMLEDQIGCYPLCVTSHRLTSVFGFLPVVKKYSGEDIWNYKQSTFNENIKPYEYKSLLEGCTVKFTPGERTGIIEVEFDEPEMTNILRFTTLNPKGGYEYQGEKAICGEAFFNGMYAFTYIEFDNPTGEYWMTKDTKGIAIRLCPGQTKIRIKYAISYVDMNQAKDNLRREIPGFDYDKVQSAARAKWDGQLGKIEVKGGSEKQKRVFYTSLYRCFERMVNINEYGRYFSAFDHQIHESEAPFYVDNWLWDTYISLEPLQTILNPDMEVDKINSYLEMYRQGGAMPSFATVFGDWPAMTGNYAAVWMADAMNKGLEFDLNTAFEGLKFNSINQTKIPWRNGPNTSIDVFYNEHGYMPALHPGEKETVNLVDTVWERRQAVSITTAFSYADWGIAQIARALGRKDDEKLFLERAAFYKNVYHPVHKMFWPKDENGEWIEGLDPRYMDRMYFTENNAYTFMWDVKHDFEGLFELMGGKKAADSRLDKMFHTPLGKNKWEFYNIIPDSSGMVGQFSMGNEPSFHIPYIYDYTGSPWKTQRRIHHLIDNFFTDEHIGLPGDEDGGGMCSFVVFSMMGFFPVSPGIPVYAIGSPFFESVTINLPSGRKFTVKAENYAPENIFIQSAKLNGKTLERCWFSHEELTNGGVLELTMGPRPNREWAAGDDCCPPSSLNFTKLGE